MIDWAERLASGAAIDGRVVVVVAHADDETLFAGPLLRRLRDGVLIHVTDGAPRDMGDAVRLGFATRAAYAATREAELEAAVAALGAAVARRAYGIADQEASFAVAAVAERLAGDLAGAAAVVTHAYEGGHPDHDATALAVHLAAARLARDGAGPAVVEVPSYHLRDGARIWAEFWPDAAHREHVRAFDADDVVRVEAALAAHASQATVFDDWRPRTERYRIAPAHDFTAMPPPGACLYDLFGWALTSERWRALAATYVGNRGLSGFAEGE